MTIWSGQLTLALVYAATPFDQRRTFAATRETWEALRRKGLVQRHAVTQYWVATEAGLKLLAEAQAAAEEAKASTLGKAFDEGT